MELRDYQTEAVNQINTALETDPATLYVIPTGAGKTVVAAHVANAKLKSGRIMVVAHRDELIRQASKTFAKITGVQPEIEKAQLRVNENGKFQAQIVIASVQTLNSGTDNRRMSKFNPAEFSLLWIDEAHHGVADTYLRVIEHFRQNPDLRVLGCTATPDRADERGLAEIFPSVAYQYDLPDAIAGGWLVPVRQYRAWINELDFSKIKSDASDFIASALELAMNQEGVLHAVVHATLETACGLDTHALEAIRDDTERQQKLSDMLDGRKPKKTLIFCAGVAQAQLTAEILNRWLPGCADSVNGKTPYRERARMLRRYHKGDFQFLVNVGVATEGFDEPGIELVSVARPTQSRSLYSQMIGRGTRPCAAAAKPLGSLNSATDRCMMIAASEKPCLSVLDFAGNAGRHKLVCMADLLGVAKPKEVVDRATEILDEESMDVSRAIAMAEAEVAVSQEYERMLAESEASALEQQQEQGILKHLVGTTQYSLTRVNAFDGCDVSPNVKGGRWDEATEKQKNLLMGLGVSAKTVNGWSQRQASVLIGKLKQQRATDKQRMYLRRLGVPAEEIGPLNFYQASAWIEQKVGSR